MALLTPAVWAIACLLDSCLIGNKIYRSPIEGTVISCLFFLLPLVFVLGWGGSGHIAPTLNLSLSTSAVGAGVAFLIHIFFYFRILFQINDVSGTETFVALSVLIVPLFSWLLLDEVLPSHYYAAFLLAAAGVALQCLPMLRRLGLSLLFNMLSCLVTVSLTMVLQAQALKDVEFVASTISFNATCVGLSIASVVLSRKLRRLVIYIYRHFYRLLIITEFLGILALVCSHRATQMSPSVSLVALIECLLPLVIILLSLVLITLNRFFPVFSNKNQKILALQVSDLPSKTIALTLLIVAVTTVSF